MLKFESLATIGQKIRAYDFMGNTEAFIEGEIVEKGWLPNGCKGYAIKIEKDGADFGREGDTGYVPFEVAFMEYDNRIEVVA